MMKMLPIFFITPNLHNHMFLTGYWMTSGSSLQELKSGITPVICTILFTPGDSIIPMISLIMRLPI